MKQIPFLFLCWFSLCAASPLAKTGGMVSSGISEEVFSKSSVSFKSAVAEVVRTDIFAEDFESGLGQWTTSYSVDNSSFTPRYWVLNQAAPGNHPGAVAYGIDFPGGDCGESLESGRIMLMSPVVTLPSTAPGNYWLAFDHYFDFEERLDGGILWYKLNSGFWMPIHSSFFSSNGYNHNPTAEVDPFQGQSYFSGKSNGWKKSLINLRDVSMASGNTIQFAWVVGTDGCGGVDGWYVDNIELYHEYIVPEEPQVEFELESASVNESAADMPGRTYECTGFVDHSVTVKMNKPASQPVTVNFKIILPDENEMMDPSFDAALYATEGQNEDFSLSTTKVVFGVGETSKTISIRVNNDTKAEKDEMLRLGFSIITSSDAQIGAKKVYTLTIEDDDDGLSPTYTEVGTENFTSGVIPEGWSLQGSHDVAKWEIVSNDYVSGYGLQMRVDDGWSYDESIVSRSFNTADYSEIFLKFFQYLYINSDAWHATANIEVWTGSEWKNVLTQEDFVRQRYEDGHDFFPVETTVSIPSAYANGDMKFRFSIEGEGPVQWAIDNIVLTGANYQKEIQAEVSVTPDVKHLGPNATVYFFDPETQSVLAKLKNLTDFDYGCTSVAIDRAGDGSTEWLDGYSISNKTLRIIPSNPNPAGKYEITVFYKTSELGDFFGSITSMGKSEGGIGVGDASGSEVAAVQMSRFNNDYAFTSVFETGFSGFGLSNAPASTSLPVRLTNLEGVHTNEGNLLHWTTTEEVNNDYFAIERSPDASKFVEIGRMPATEPLGKLNTYRFTDLRYLAGMNYYRLKQMDKDGKYAYSKTIAVKTEGRREPVLFPNPVHATMTIEIPDVGVNSGDIKVFNSSGRSVFEKKGVEVENGKIAMDVSHIQAGVYQVQLTIDGKKFNYPVIKY